MNLSRSLLSLIWLAAPMGAADTLTGFPFQNETLRYNVKLLSGVSLGEATVSAQKSEGGGWRFDMSFKAGVPGFTYSDSYHSSVDAELCSSELNREMQHGNRKITDKISFDQKRNMAERKTIFPAGGGRSEVKLPTCARDALAFQFFARREMGQGKVTETTRIFFGGGYDVRRMEYTGAMNLTMGGKIEITDHCNVSIKGPASDLTIEVFYARDAARTPLLIRVPAPIGKISLELTR